MKKKTVIVTPVKNLLMNNRQDYFNRLTYSIQFQENQDIEHLLVVGNSSDETNSFVDKYAKEYSNVKLVYTQESELAEVGLTRKHQLSLESGPV